MAQRISHRICLPVTETDFDKSVSSERSAEIGDKQELMGEVDRLKKLLEGKKRGKNSPGGSSPSNLSSDNRRPPDPDKPPRLLRDRRSGKDLEIHETIPCPIDSSILPPDAIRVQDQSVIVQEIIIKPRNIEFRQEVYYSLKELKYYRGALPAGYQVSDFGPDLRALILSLKYCGNMSEPKIGEFLENFGVEVSSGSLSNILTKTADQFEAAYHDVLLIVWQFIMRVRLFIIASRRLCR